MYRTDRIETIALCGFDLEIRAGEFILVGGNAEDAVVSMGLGLLQRNKKVSVVVDAVGCRNRSQADLAIRKVQAKGAHLIETKKLAGTSHLRSVRICNCELCRSYARRGFAGLSHN